MLGNRFLSGAGALALSATLLVAGPARAEEAAPRGDAAEGRGSGEASLLARTRFLDALHVGDWQAAVLAWRSVPAGARTPALCVLAARAHERLGELGPAAALLDGVLRARADDLDGLYLAARVRARQGRLDDARELLIGAARAGRQVLRELYAGEARELLGGLLREPGFVLRVMRASREAPLERGEVRDPFARPAASADRRGGAKEEPRAPSLEDARALELRLDALLAALRVAAREKDIERLRGGLEELAELLRRYGALAADATARRLAGLRQDERELRSLLVALRLQLWVEEGNGHLRAMADALRREAWGEALARFPQLSALCERMRAPGDELCARAAAQLFARGKHLAERARLYQQVERLELRVTGVVVTPEEGERRAIVNGHILAPGAPVDDPRTGDPVPDLRLVAIEPSQVTFRFRELSFVRALAPRGPRPGGPPEPAPPRARAPR